MEFFRHLKIHLIPFAGLAHMLKHFLVSIDIYTYLSCTKKLCNSKFLILEFTQLSLDSLT